MRDGLILRGARIDRIAALRLLIDLLVSGADDAPCRDSESWLRLAASDVANALSVEQRRALT